MFKEVFLKAATFFTDTHECVNERYYLRSRQHAYTVANIDIVEQSIVKKRERERRRKLLRLLFLLLALALFHIPSVGNVSQQYRTAATRVQ